MKKLAMVLMTIMITFSTTKQANAFVWFTIPAIPAAAAGTATAIGATVTTVRVARVAWKIRGLYGSSKIIKMMKEGKNLKEIAQGVRWNIKQGKMAGKNMQTSERFLKTLEIAIKVLV